MVTAGLGTTTAPQRLAPGEAILKASPAGASGSEFWKCYSCHSATTQLGPTDSVLISAKALFQTGC